MATKSKKSMTISLPIEEEMYSEFISDSKISHKVIKDFVERTPELFPATIVEKDYVLYGKDRKSKKMDIQLRKIENWKRDLSHTTKLYFTLYAWKNQRSSKCAAFGLSRCAILGIGHSVWSKPHVLVPFVHLSFPV
ncbi:MAG: hypothetical protein GY705_08560 [Bacteroidetes bacterium]|nr:hypothetical protein [Bacteroidota bacterium]